MAERDNGKGKLKCYECQRYLAKGSFGLTRSKEKVIVNPYCPKCLRKRSVFYGMKRLLDSEGMAGCEKRINEIKELLANSKEALARLRGE